jgi:hypothetical protein
MCLRIKDDDDTAPAAAPDDDDVDYDDDKLTTISYTCASLLQSLQTSPASNLELHSVGDSTMLHVEKIP